MLELLKGLPIRAEIWVRSKLEKFTWKRLLINIAKLTFFIVFTIMIAGIMQGTSYEFWQNTVVPWLKTKRFDLTNGSLLISRIFCIMGWGVATISGLLTFLFYGADRRRLGQLEQVNKENREREVKIDELNKEIGKLSSELQKAQQAGGQLLAMFGALDRELLMLLTQDNLTERSAISAFFESICSRLFDYLREDSDVFRASIYVVDEQNPEFLAIKWDYGVGEVSRRWNKWYIGDHDPEKLGVHRGIPGEVFVKGKGRVNEHVRDDPDFYDPHQPHRLVLPYNTTLHAVIHPNDISRKYGVFCIDSLTYKFTENDLEITQQVAIRLGWLIHWSQTSGIIKLSEKEGDIS